MFTALGLAMGAAHALELIPKMGYDADLYLAVTSTLYRLFGSVGAVIQVGAAVAVAALLWPLRRDKPAFHFTLAALVALLISLALWTALVMPVNTQWGGVLRSDPASAPAAYARLRPRWEYGRVAAFAAWLIGFACLALSVLRPGRSGVRSR
jgi:hypothetical protein